MLRLILLAGGASALIAGGLALEFWREAPTVPTAAPVASPPPAPLWTAPPVAAAPDLSALTRRPPFSAARRPVPAGQPAPLAAEPDPDLLFDRYAVAGVMMAGPMRVALLRDTVAGALLRLKVGDALDEATLIGVSMGELTFRAGDATVVAPVERRDTQP